jgi:RNA polymerase sigma-70 factor (ECF subfamily)
MTDDRTSQLQRLIDLLQQGDASARDRLLDGAYDRLPRLTRKMLKGYPGVRAFEETDDVLQNAALRLRRALVDVVPSSVRDFIGLAATQVRRELIDLARYYQGRVRPVASPAPPSEGRGSNEGAEPASPPDLADTTEEPNRLALWTEFHERVGALPEEEREVFNLLWYQGLTHQEAAAVVKVSPATIKRRWNAARRNLYHALGGQLPD